MTNNPTTRELLERCLSALNCRVAASKPVRALRVELRYFLDTRPHEHEWDINSEGTATVCYCGARSSDTPAVERQEPVAIVDESDDGLFIEFIYGEDGTPLRRGDLLYADPPEVAALQSTIAQLQAEQQLLQSTVARYLDRIAELESGRGEPVAWIKPEVAATLTGDECCYAFGSQNPKGNLVPLYTATPAPVATLWEICVRDEPGNPESPCEYVYVSSEAERDSLIRQGGATVYAEYGCLDATAALNGDKP